jgi:hypothetical protein
MANEIYSALTLTARKSGAIVSLSSSINQDMTGSNMLQATQLIGTTAELVGFGDISGAPSQVMIKNLDTTNFVELGGDSGLTVFKLKLMPGKHLLIPPSSGTLYAKADTANVRIQIVASEL